MSFLSPSQPSAAMLEEMAHAAFARIPAPFSDHLGQVVVRIEEFADAEVLESVGLNDPWRLSGLYHGVPMGQQSVWSSGQMPPMITLYRQPILAEWRNRGVDLAALVAHVVIHEVGHHFGLSDEDMHALERQVD
ncbi:MAG: metallopeptidase family protein [Novosphingobium sp.]|nr:metallopeptidase family protein [Novosphingobium sp.]